MHLARWRAAAHPDNSLYTFLPSSGSPVEMCYRDLDATARAIAASLAERTRPGDRVVVLTSPGLDFAGALYGVLYAGCVAVPAWPLEAQRSAATVARLARMVEDCEASAALVSDAEVQRERLAEVPGLARLPWIDVSRVGLDQGVAWREPTLDRETLALLQYTSGSTASPKGVMLTHGNLLANCAAIARSFGESTSTRGVLWLPPYHDMGLVGGILGPLYVGGRCALLTPQSFLMRPYRWLKAISDLRATTSGGPGFAFDLCVERIRPEQLETLDLSSWRVAFCGSERVRADTIERFCRAFAPCGFDPRAFFPCYGLAESTLIVSGGPAGVAPRVRSYDPAALDAGRGVEREGGVPVVGCGMPDPATTLAIVDPDTGHPLAAGQIGEIWVASASVARGYWRREEATAEVFAATIAGRTEHYLRTGDLGFIDAGGELVITGRIKELVKLSGRNHYPQDLEATALASHPSTRGEAAAFSVEGEDGERLVVVVRARPDDAEQVRSAAREAIARAHEIGAEIVVTGRALPSTLSGKLQRFQCRRMYLEGGFLPR